VPTALKDNAFAPEKLTQPFDHLIRFGSEKAA
jgi:hypothetical protein